jgi:hypothetical protein
MATATRTDRNYNKRKRALCALFLFLSLFSCSSCPRWRLDEVSPCNPCFRSARIYFDNHDPFCRLEIEMVNSPSGMRLYVNTYSRPLPKQISVTMMTVDDSGEFPAEVLEGGQRLLLPDPARDFLISHLLSGQCVELTVGSYQTTVPPSQFAKVFSTASKY